MNKNNYLETIKFEFGDIIYDICGEDEKKHTLTHKNGTARVVGIKGAHNEFVIPKTINGLIIDEIGVLEQANVRRLVLPDTVISINDTAFITCRAIQEISFPFRFEDITNNDFFLMASGKLIKYGGKIEIRQNNNENYDFIPGRIIRHNMTKNPNSNPENAQ